MVKLLFPEDFVSHSKKQIFHPPDQWMHQWVQCYVEMSSLFRKFPDLCEAAHPSFHELAILGGTLEYHMRGANPDIEVQSINDNLC